MDPKQLSNTDEITSAKYWKPIYAEIKRILEQREISEININPFYVQKLEKNEGEYSPKQFSLTNKRQRR